MASCDLAWLERVVTGWKPSHGARSLVSSRAFMNNRPSAGGWLCGLDQWTTMNRRQVMQPVIG
ncbi:hypothetical protein GF325_17370 [Candidatus Bathyarchaeota archaeon]|nr:hypothetical protein [Candidatus Bathyarchaeota archaeon]